MTPWCLQRNQDPCLDPRTPQLPHLSFLSFAPSTPRHRNALTPNTVPGRKGTTQVWSPARQISMERLICITTTSSLLGGMYSSVGDQRGAPPAVENFSQEVLPNLHPEGMGRLKEGRKGLRARRQRSRRNRTPRRWSA